MSRSPFCWWAFPCVQPSVFGSSSTTRNATPRIVAREKKSGRVHLAWMCKLYLKQLSEGRLFLHEHPANATSRNEECILEVLQHTGVSRITADRFQLGQETDKGEPNRKPTGFMSNCEDILDQLHKRCQGRGGQCSRPSGGTHLLCHGRVARRASIFQRAVLRRWLWHYD